MATRFYLSRDQSAAVSPAFGAWDVTTNALRRALLTAAAGGEALSNRSQLLSNNGLWFQFVSDGLAAQTVSGTIKIQSRCRDIDTSGDVTTRLLAKVVSEDGGTLRGTLLALGNYGPATFVSASARNKTIADGDALSAVVAQAGDRLVIELGFNNPSSDETTMSYGAPLATSDLPENETETGALLPWIELSANLVFAGGVNNAKNLLLLGVG